MVAEKCKQVVSVQADLDRIPRSRLKKERGQDNQWYYKVWFQTRMTSNLANIPSKLVHDNNVEYGTVDAVWDNDYLTPPCQSLSHQQALYTYHWQVIISLETHTTC